MPTPPNPTAKKWDPVGKGYLSANEVVEQLGPGQRQQRQLLREQQVARQAPPPAGPPTPDLTRTALLHATRVTAQQRIKNQAFRAAPQSREEIWNFCEWILEQEPEGDEKSLKDGKLSVPPIKSEKRAGEKVITDYASFTGGPKRKAVRGDWYGVKDLARLTVVLPDDERCKQALQKVTSMFAPQHGRSVIVQKTIDPLEDSSGYSGYVAFVKTSNGWPAEIQINIATIIYAKEKEKDAKSVLGEAEFNRIKMLYGLDCGLGHALYEYTRKPGADPAMATKAREASKAYYAYFRSAPPNPMQRHKVLTMIEGLGIDLH